uniref:AlNc14C151G7524 protein n=1 Tax=Albugo laibachii Nc14 TaxID=890382 RepID=F0WM11_9STRA|nr:AlNc14C151G7524 [Albugo laibachii Nc14]|eukprot:CCA22338.1 AlNc14C151G7524 [Albugo laibachii Nc14]
MPTKNHADPDAQNFVFAGLDKVYSSPSEYRHPHAYWFNEKMKSEERHVLLLLDNVFYHHPQDAGIIQSFKSKLEQLKTRYIVSKFDELLDKAAEVENENVEKQIESLYTVDVLQMMQWSQEAWETVTSTTVANCWGQTKII